MYEELKEIAEDAAWDIGHEAVNGDDLDKVYMSGVATEIILAAIQTVLVGPELLLETRARIIRELTEELAAAGKDTARWEKIVADLNRRLHEVEARLEDVTSQTEYRYHSEMEHGPWGDE